MLNLGVDKSIDSIILLALPFLLITASFTALTFSSSAFGQAGQEASNTISISSANSTLANLAAEAQIPPSSSFVLLAYCPPGSLDISECETLIFPVPVAQPQVVPTDHSQP